MKQNNWHKFCKNKLALSSLYLIILLSIAAILGYSITPDSSPNCNTQIPELRNMHPGTSVMFLKINKNELIEKKSFFNQMLFGEENNYTLIPYSAFHFKGFNIIIQSFDKTETLTYHLADVVYHLNLKQPIINDNIHKEVSFFEFANSSVKQTKNIKELQQIILSHHLNSKTFWLGTDITGRDMLSRLIIGSRISLSIGFVAVFISVIIGLLVGAIAAYFSGIIDKIIMYFINIIWAIPTVLLIVIITLILGKGIMQVFIAVGLTMWIDIARLVRGQILSLKQKEFIEATKVLGFSDYRILVYHLIPNVFNIVLVAASTNFATAILMEAGLSFLGIGAQPPMASWGQMINAHRGYIMLDSAYLALLPGLAIMLLVLAFTFVSNGLRDAFEYKN